MKNIKAFYVANDITEIDLPSELSDLPALGDTEESGTIGYIIVSNGEEITIIANEEEYLAYMLLN